MKRIYVAGPYSSDNVIEVLQNIGHGKDVCADLFLLGYAPFCPWHDKTYVEDRYLTKFTVKQFYEYSIVWLEVCDAVLLIGDWTKSKGVLAEIERAKELGIPVFESLGKLMAWDS